MFEALIGFSVVVLVISGIASFIHDLRKPTPEAMNACMAEGHSGVECLKKLGY